MKSRIEEGKSSIPASLLQRLEATSSAHADGYGKKITIDINAVGSPSSLPVAAWEVGNEAVTDADITLDFQPEIEEGSS
jgi:hypothetical protein